ncbi:MAG: L-arabinose ABC transporter permease AraH [Spirochaetales bacterium]
MKASKLYNTSKTTTLIHLVSAIWANAGLSALFILMFAALSLFVPNFFSVPNMIGLSLSVSMVGMVASTMLFCLAGGNFDLSVEAIVAFSGVVVATLINITGNLSLSIGTSVLLGALIGLINGLIIAKLKINALITTLATMQIVRGLGYITSGGISVGVIEERFFLIGNGTSLGIPNPIWVTILCFIVFGVLLNFTSYGKNTLAIGGNREAARLAGINVDLVKILNFTLQGAVAGLAGVILASRMTSGQPTTSQGFALDVISACVLGGVSLSGGVGTMGGVIIGVLIMGTMQNALNLLNIPTFYQYVIRGVVLLLAVFLDQFR